MIGEKKPMPHTRSPWVYVVLSGAAALLGAATLLLFGVDLQPISAPRAAAGLAVVGIAMMAIVVVLRSSPRRQCETCDGLADVAQAVDHMQKQLNALDSRTELRAAATRQALGRSGREWGADELRDVVYGTGEVPVGLDPEAIAAARRIARALSGVTAGSQRRVH
ncbi:hypothetical protein [Actinoplanes sp. NPDC048796]|uniref:hypothetical protein n=1 Tax=Actinoplanes sp. NPDC048796 TaxID=3155640 RepID=UPI0033F5BF40